MTLFKVTDHLGTPRMIFDQSGSLANVKRHDYLPFGEELFAPTGGRTTAQGYSLSDGLRQKFTSKERDNETGLDYFLARYYSNVQGRFTSADELTSVSNPIAYADTGNPQSLNKYHYVNNNPINIIDPDGHCPENQPCPTTSYQSSNPIPELRGQENLVAGVADVAISAGKVAANVGIGLNNLSHFFLNNNDPSKMFESFEPSSKVQYVAMHAFEVASVVAPFLPKAGPVTVISAETRPVIASSTSAARQLGQQGELASGVARNTNRIPSLTGTANYRRPDGLNPAARTIDEVKNVAYQARTNQIRDDILYANQEHFTFTLHVRSTTRLSVPLQREVAAGNVRLRTFNNRTFNPSGFKF